MPEHREEREVIQRKQGEKTRAGREENINTRSLVTPIGRTGACITQDQDADARSQAGLGVQEEHWEPHGEEAPLSAWLCAGPTSPLSSCLMSLLACEVVNWFTMSSAVWL